MTALETIKFNEAIETPVDHFTSLSITEHIQEASKVYMAIRPFLTGISWLAKALFPKLSVAITKLTTVLDGLFGAIAITNF